MIITSVAAAAALAGSSTADNPIIGWHNLVTVGSVSSPTAAAGYPVTNVANPAAHLIWRSGVNTGDEYLIVVTGYASPIDYLAVARHNFGSAATVVSVEGCTSLGSSPQVWTEIVEQHLLEDDSPVLFRFVPQVLAGVRLRMQPDVTAPEAAVLYAGKLLIFERSIEVDTPHAPFNFGQVTKTTVGFSESGQLLGRTVLTRKATSRADFKDFTADWYRDNLQEVIEGAQIDPFFFAWNPREYPEEIGFAWLASNPMPSVDPVTKRISITLAMEGLR